MAKMYIKNTNTRKQGFSLSGGGLGIAPLQRRLKPTTKFQRNLAIFSVVCVLGQGFIHKPHILFYKYFLYYLLLFTSIFCIITEALKRYSNSEELFAKKHFLEKIVAHSKPEIGCF